MDEAYRQGKVFMANWVIALIDQGASTEKIRLGLTDFLATREDKAEAVAQLRALIAEPRIETVSVSPDSFTGDFIH